ncbi:hypothetical protein V494_02831 [Pseudogymnoascus sp. VKM F-4513 (FW-928)]|nr:hypothetical protein V494_02831 [Pseudogymnoascus sp. VKM F-4513 (FW-928)]
MGTSGYPPGWEADYDGETERWFYTHKPTGVRQYHFPKAGDEVKLAAAMNRSKAANEAKLKGDKTPGGSKVGGSTNVTPSTPVQQVQPSIFSNRDDLGQSPTIKRSVSERVTPTSSQPIPKTFRQSFQAAQRTDATAAQRLPFQHGSLAALPPLNTQLHVTSRPPYQVASSAHPLSINTSALNQGGNVSPVQSVSAGPWSYSTSKGPGMSSNDRGSSFSSQGSLAIPGPSAPVASKPPAVPPKVPEPGSALASGNKYVGHTTSHSSPVPHSDANEVISTRLGILFLLDCDKEDIITNLQNLARMYPDVTLPQLLDPHMELPRPRLSVPPTSSIERERDGGSDETLQSTNARDPSPGAAPVISADASLPIAFVAYSREPQPTHRTYTSPVAGPNPSVGTSFPSSSSDYQRRQHSSSNVSITSTAVQSPHNRTQSSSFSSRRQDSIGTQTYSPETRSELAQTAWGLKPSSASADGPTMPTSFPARPPMQSLESSPDALGSRLSRQQSVNRKPLSSQSPIMNRPYRSLSWQPRDHSPNPQLPSSLVSEVPEDPPTPPGNATQQGPLVASDSSDVQSEKDLRPTASPELIAASTTRDRISGPGINDQSSSLRSPSNRRSGEVPIQQQPQEKSGIDQRELDRLNSIIEDQNKQLALLYQQNTQALLDLQNQQNATALHQARYSEHIGLQRHSSVPAPSSTRSSTYTQSSLQNIHYPPSYPSVPVSPISRPDSLVYAIQDEQPRPLSLPEPAFDTTASRPEDTSRIGESNCSPIDEVQVNANAASDGSQQFGDQSAQAPSFQSNITQDSTSQEPEVDYKEITSNQTVDTTIEMGSAASSVRDRSQSRGSTQTDSKRGSWSHVRTHSATQQIQGQNVFQADTGVRDRSQSPASNHTGSTRGSWSHVRTQSATQELKRKSLQSSVPQAGLQTQQQYIVLANPASESQPQSAQSYQTQNIMSLSATHEISLQKALEAQIQQHLEASVSPQSATSAQNPLHGFNSDSAVSDMSTPGLVHKEYFDPASVQNWQAQRRISKDLSTTTASIAGVVGSAPVHVRKPSFPNKHIMEEPKYYEDKQAFFPAHAPLKIGVTQSTGLQNAAPAEQKPAVPGNTGGVSSRKSSSGSAVNEGPELSGTSVSNQPAPVVSSSRPNEAEAASKATAPLETKLIAASPPAGTNTNISQTGTHSSKPSVSSQSEIAKQSYPPQPTFTVQHDAEGTESLYDGDGYGDYDYSDDEPTSPQFVAPQPHLLHVRPST